MSIRESPASECATLDDDDAVASKPRPRKMQKRGRSFDVAPPKSFVEYLNLDTQSALADAKLIKGTKPVVIDEPALVLRAYKGCESE